MISRILITGGTGFLGRALISRLSKISNVCVDVLYRNNVFKESGKGNIRYLNLANFDPSEIEYDVVLHLAAYITAARDKASTTQLIQSNILFGAQLLSEVRIKNGGLFVDTGSFAELHSSRDEVNVSYLYSETKKSFENIAKFFATINQYNYCKVIPYTVISKERQDKKLIDVMLSSLDADLPVKMTSGEQVLDFIDRDDVVCLYEALVLEDDFSRLNNETLECCSGKGTSVLDLAEMIKEISGKPLNIDWGAMPYRETDIMKAVGNPSNTNKLTGWHSSDTLFNTLKKIID